MKNHPAVADCVAIGQRIGKDKTLVAICVVPQSGQKAEKAALLQYGAEHLAGYKRPRIIHLMDEYPRTRNGKVIRSALARMMEAQSDIPGGT